MLSDTMPAPYKRGRKVCIVGFAKTSRDLALYADPEWEIWGVNDAWSFAHRADRWFEVHSTWIYEWELRRAKGHLDWLRRFGEQGGIVYLLTERPDMPHARAFPFDSVVANLWPELATEGNHKTSRPYLTSSIAYMQALAIAEGFEEIAIVGVDMAADSEYADQKPCCEYLIGLARGRGIKSWLPESCGLLSGPLYGRGAMNPEGERISPEQLSARHQRLQELEARTVKGMDAALATVHKIEGAMKFARDMLAEFPTSGPAINAHLSDLEAQYREAHQARAQHKEAYDNVQGALIECRQWIGLTPHGGDARLIPPVILPPPNVASEPPSEEEEEIWHAPVRKATLPADDAAETLYRAAPLNGVADEAMAVTHE